MPQTYWYVLYTAPRAEKKVDARLTKKGVKTYLPIIKTLKQWSDRKKWVEEPAFKSYLFVNSSPDQLKSILTNDGIIKVISFDGQPQKVPDDQIKWLKLLLESPELIEITGLISKGDDVEIMSGPFVGVRGKVIYQKSKKNFAVNIDILGQSICLEIPHHLLKKLPANN